MSEASRDQDGSANREIVIARVLPAPRDVVFRAWTNSEHVAQWWGPKGFANTLSEMDVRPGGVWRFEMDGPDGTEFKNQISFIEVVEPERLVYAHCGDGADGADDGACHYHVTVSFAEQGPETKLTMRLLFETPEERDRTARFGAERGGNQMLDRLERYLSTGETSRRAGQAAATAPDGTAALPE